MKRFSFLLVTLFFSFASTITAQWQHIGSGFEEPTEFYSIWAVDEDVIWALPLYSTVSGEVFFTKTIDGGDSWQPGALPASANGYFGTKIFALDEHTAWVIMGSSSDPVEIKIFKTNDGGTTWLEQTGEFNEMYQGFFSIHFFNENEGIGFGSTSGGYSSSVNIYLTSDGGETWVRVPEENMPDLLINERVNTFSGNNSYEVIGDTLWFVTSHFRIFRTTDKGLSWEAFSGPGGVQVYPSGLSSIAFEDAQNGIVVTFSTTYAWKTNDGGETWSGILLPDIYFVNGTSIEHIPGTESTYMITCGWFHNRSFTYTTDGGISWVTPPYEGAVDFPVLSCVQFLSPTVGFGGANPDSDADPGGIYKWTGNWLDSTSVTSLKPLSNYYFKIYPNPTSGEIFVTGSSPQSIVKVGIFGISGANLLQFDFLPDDKTEFSLDLRVLSPGIYFMELTNDRGNAVVYKFIKIW